MSKKQKKDAQGTLFGVRMEAASAQRYHRLRAELADARKAKRDADIVVFEIAHAMVQLFPKNPPIRRILKANGVVFADYVGYVLLTQLVHPASLANLARLFGLGPTRTLRAYTFPNYEPGDALDKGRQDRAINVVTAVLADIQQHQANHGVHPKESAIRLMVRQHARILGFPPPRSKVGYSTMLAIAEAALNKIKSRSNEALAKNLAGNALRELQRLRRGV